LFENVTGKLGQKGGALAGKMPFLTFYKRSLQQILVGWGRINLLCAFRAPLWQIQKCKPSMLINFEAVIDIE